MLLVVLKVARDGNHQGYLHILFPALLAEQLELVLQDFELEHKQKKVSPMSGAIESLSESGTGRNESLQFDSRILLVNESENDVKPLREMLENEKLDL